MNYGYLKRSFALIKQEPIFVGFFALFFVALQFFALSMPKIEADKINNVDTFLETFTPYLLPYLGKIMGEVYMGLFVLMLGVAFVKTSEMDVRDVFVRSVPRFATLFLGQFVLMLILGALVVGLLFGFNSGFNPVSILLALSSGFLAVFASLAVMLFIPVAVVHDESLFGSFGRLRNLIKEHFRDCVSVLVLTFIVEFVFQTLSVLFGSIPVIGMPLDVGVFSISNTLTTFIVMLFVLDLSMKSEISVLIEDVEDEQVSV